MLLRLYYTIIFIIFFLVTQSNCFPSNKNETFSSTSNSTSKTCSSDDGCNYPHGLCVSSSCSCRLFYSGHNCETAWKDDEQFNIWYNIYAAWVILTQFCCVVVCGYQLYITFKHANVGNWIKLNITTYQLMIIFAAGIGKPYDMIPDSNPISSYHQLLDRPPGLQGYCTPCCWWVHIQSIPHHVVVCCLHDLFVLVSNLIFIF